jgi:transcriptional regulator with XRE-family HTH domain
MDDTNELRRIVGAAVMAARERAGFTQAEVASRMGISTAVYGRIERGHMLPSIPTLCQLCTALDIPASVLIGLNPEEMKGGPSRVGPNDSPELRRFANALRKLSPAALRAMSALVSIISSK